MTMAQLFGYLVAICVSIWGVFYTTEQVVCAKYRKEFAQRLREFDMKHWGQEWPREVLHLFDNTFGTKSLTWRFFLRSVVCSVVFYILVAITYISISPNYGFLQFYITFLNLTEASLESSLESSLGFLLEFLLDLLENVSWVVWVTVLYVMSVFVLIFNATADYISLLETRCMIRLLANNPSFRRMVIILLADLIVTAVIFAIWLSILMLIITVIDGKDLGWWLKTSVEVIIFLFTTTPSTGESNANNAPVYFAFYTTFATSIWVWVNIVGLCCLGLLRNVCNPLWLWLRDTFLATNERPFLAVGFTICLCVIFGTIVIAIYKGVAVMANF